MPPGHASTDELALASPSTQSVARDLIVTENITIEAPAERYELALVGTHAFTSGIVLLRYRAGWVPE